MRQNLEDLPHIDLYRRLEGSLSPAALAELDGAAALSDQPGAVERSIVRPGEAFFQAALKARARRIAPIPTLNSAVQRVLKEAEVDSLRRIELVFSPAWLAAAGGYEQGTAFETVLRAPAEPDSGRMTVGWIAAIPAESSTAEVEATIALCKQHRAHGIVGISLLLDGDVTRGEERRRAVSAAKEAGLGIVLDTGTVTSATMVADALEALEVDRVVDGSLVLGDPRALSAAKAGRATMLTCLMGHVGKHPALPAMIQAGLQVTLTTWAPGMIGTSMDKEYQVASESFGLSRESLKGLSMAAAQNSFMDKGSKRKLERELEADLFDFPVT